MIVDELLTAFQVADLQRKPKKIIPIAFFYAN
jgi:hypothetical protein